jgi:Tol biopolymer transport system component
MTKTITRLAAAVTLLVGAAGSAPTVAAAGEFHLASTIAFSSTRDGNLEIYLMAPDGTNQRRLTNNSDGDGFAVLSPDGKKLAFDSNRNRAPNESVFTSDLFLMNTDGSEQTLLTRGSSASWSADSKRIAFHASASGSGTPLRTDPGSATNDSDIFVANVDDLVAGAESARNLTRGWTEADGQRSRIADDSDWSPSGNSIVFTAHDAGDDIPNPPGFLSNSAELYLLDPAGTGSPHRLTYTSVPGDGLPDEEERGPAWSADGTRIVYSCRISGGTADFELCVINADGSDRVQLTNNSVSELSPTFSPDDRQIVFHRLVAGQGLQQFTIPSTPDADGTFPTAQLTRPPGQNLLAHWGELRVHDQNKKEAP